MNDGFRDPLAMAGFAEGRRSSRSSNFHAGPRYFVRDLAIALAARRACFDGLADRHAANFLGVAQSSVSLRVKAPEEELGVLLFERHSRGVRLTDAGRHFVGNVAVGIAQLDHAVKTAGGMARGDLGQSAGAFRLPLTPHLT